MLIGKFRHLPSARCTLHKTLFDKERLIDLLDGSGVFAQRGSDGSQSHRTSFKLVDNGAQNLVVYLVEPVAVDVQRFEREPGNVRIDGACPFHLRKVPHTAKQGIGYTRSAAAARRYFRRCRNGARHIEDGSGTADDRTQHIVVVILQVQIDAETRAKRSRKQPAACGCTHKRERTQVDLDAARRRTFVYHDVDAVIFHGGIQILLHHGRQPVNLVDEEHIVRFETGEHSCQIARFVEHRPRSDFKTHTQFVGNDVRKRRFTQSGRSVKQHVVERFSAQTGRLHKDAKVVHHLVLSAEVFETQRAKSVLKVAFFRTELMVAYIEIFFHVFSVQVSNRTKIRNFARNG